MKIRIRAQMDGSIMIPRKEKGTEDYLDQNYDRIPGQLRWFPRSVGEQTWDSLKPSFACRESYIIGKGPSLDRLHAGCFRDSTTPIICINESIHKVESLEIENPIFVIQQDVNLKCNCKPSRGTVIVSLQARHWYSDFERKIIYDPRELGMNSNALTVKCALGFLQRFGCDTAFMVCFDSCMNQSLEYAECIGYEPTYGGRPDRFLSHYKKITEAAGSLQLIWIMPTAPVEASSDTPQQ